MLSPSKSMDRSVNCVGEGAVWLIGIGDSSTLMSVDWYVQSAAGSSGVFEGKVRYLLTGVD